MKHNHYHQNNHSSNHHHNECNCPHGSHVHTSCKKCSHLHIDRKQGSCDWLKLIDKSVDASIVFSWINSKIDGLYGLTVSMVNLSMILNMDLTRVQLAVQCLIDEKWIYSITVEQVCRINTFFLFCPMPVESCPERDTRFIEYPSVVIICDPLGDD